MKILFICTSNTDRSPALEKYFSSVYPQHEYRSAGINKYFCTQKGTHYLTQDDIDWTDLIVFAEHIHLKVTANNYGFLGHLYDEYENSLLISGNKNYPDSYIITDTKKSLTVLNCGNYQKGVLSDDYLTCAELKLKNILTK